MLLPAYDSHGRLYYPQYEQPKPYVEKVSVKETKLLDLPRSTKPKTRSHSPCIDDSLNAFCLQRQKQQHSMAVKEHKSLHWSVSKDSPTPALDPIPRWTPRPVTKQGETSRNSVEGYVKRSRRRDIAGSGSKHKEKKDKDKGADDHNSDSIFETPLVAPPPLDPSTASDYSAFTDIVTPDSTYGVESRPHSYVSSSFKPTKQFFASANTSTASLLSQTAPASSPKKFRRSSLFPPDGPEEYPVRGLCPHLQVLLMSGEKKASRTAIQHDRMTRCRNGPVVNRILSPATSPPIMPINEHDPLVTEIRSALETVISLQSMMDSAYLALTPRLELNRAPNVSLGHPVHFISYLSFVSSPAFKTFSGQSSSNPVSSCACCGPSLSFVKMSHVDEWIDTPYSLRQYRPPARRRADGTTLRKWCLEWQMVIHGKVDGVKPRRESTPPIQRMTSDWKRGKERWGCGCVDHGFN
ncbi:hypothetical protein QFC22_003086 [Naganishia vaughanmartiniae]|uniref:Uncharacterized protein n=1 Tax=Naganishia vaughanmartiniae TaxID=1424756 RepID=A0ACC2X8E0_9TREE|nr:hypothetical protein QFC22_003086 [Naganishia vaughanmartiniae]